MRLTREYGSSTPLARDLKITPEHIAELESKVKTPEPLSSGNDKTVPEGQTGPPSEARASGAGLYSPDMVAALRKKSTLAVELKDALVRWGKAQERELAQRKTEGASRTLNTNPVRSIRGGRPGRAAAAIGQSKPSDLTPEEMHLLMLILEAQPEEKKPKEVAAK